MRRNTDPNRPAPKMTTEECENMESSKRKLVSVVVPCFNEQEALPYFFAGIRSVAKQLPADLEIIFVDDGSKDNTLSLLRAAAKEDSRMRYISLSRNFGKESAMYAGLSASKGDYVAIMDADMQHPPRLLPQMYEILQTGEYDSVAARRSTRTGEPIIRSFFSRLFYKFISKISDADLEYGACDFRLMKRKMVDAICSMGETNRFTKGLFSWVGFRTKWLDYENEPRIAGSTKWSMRKLFKYSAHGIMAFSTTPLSISSFIGIGMCSLSLLAVAIIIIKTLLFGDPVDGWPSLACMIMFIGGLQLLCIGILGQYLAKTYMEVKNRPIYIVAETSEEYICGE